MAKSIKQNRKGEASGWYQAGSLAGVGFGGGFGLWLATHSSLAMAGIVLSVASILFALVILLIRDIPHYKEKTMLQEITVMGKGIFAMIKLPVALFVIILITMPIGTGAMANLWSAVANDWKTGADTVVLITGLLSGAVSAVGCVAGGLIVDRWASFDGWMHDKYNSRYMLSAEAIVGILFVIIFFLILKRMRKKKLIPAVID
jgi:hypothetical protein